MSGFWSFAAVAGVVLLLVILFVVGRSMLRLWRGDEEIESGGSLGRQVDKS
jgi:hypothetical protein